MSKEIFTEDNVVVIHNVKVRVFDTEQNTKLGLIIRIDERLLSLVKEGGKYPVVVLTKEMLEHE